jgi:hypothetical protein
MLLNALTALKYLEARGGGYGLPPVSAAYLTKTSPHYIGTYLLHNTTESWPLWAQLSNVVRRGTPARHAVHGDQTEWNSFRNWFSPYIGSVRMRQRWQLAT